MAIECILQIKQTSSLFIHLIKKNSTKFQLNKANSLILKVRKMAKIRNNKIKCHT